MQINTNPTALQARDLRQSASPAEMSMWAVLKGRNLGGFKFTRQYPVGPYFADFACRERCFLVEVDGSQHVDSQYDLKRDEYLLTEGYSVYHVQSAVVLCERDLVCESILAALEGRLEDFVEAFDLKFTRSFQVPRKHRRLNSWPTPTPTPRLREGR